MGGELKENRKNDKKGDKKQKKIWSTCLGILIVVLGIMGAAYPAISNYVFENRADSMIYTYEEAADSLEDQRKNELLELADVYNESLRKNKVRFIDPFGEKFGFTELEEAVRSFANQLSLDRTGVIASVEVPAIDVRLPIYAYESYEQALERGTVLVTGTSIPVGGNGTHAVISGHTGLNSAKIFTDLTSVEIGDQFLISILGDTLAYEVDKINIVEPHDFTYLGIEPDKDYCTLLTCTPYGVNSHRLLVRGVRVEYVPEAIEQIREEKVDTGSQWWEEYVRAIKAGLMIVVVIVIFLLIKRIISYAEKRRERKKNRS